MRVRLPFFRTGSDARRPLGRGARRLAGWGARPAVIALAAAVLAGCGAGRDLRGSMSRYEAGNYNAAANHCYGLSDDAQHLKDKAHVRYLVYCGLTQYRLGNREQAHRMLVSGQREYQRGRFNWLKPAIVNEMLNALDDLDRGGQKTSL